VSEPKTERRLDLPRFDVAYEATLIPSIGVVVPGHMRDVSLTGLCFLSDQIREVGERLKLVVELPDRDEPLTGEVEVIWAEERTSEVGMHVYPYAMGLQAV